MSGTFAFSATNGTVPMPVVAVCACRENLPKQDIEYGTVYIFDLLPRLIIMGYRAGKEGWNTRTQPLGAGW